jgi:hypothetical protein
VHCFGSWRKRPDDDSGTQHRFTGQREQANAWNSPGGAAQGRGGGPLPAAVRSLRSRTIVESFVPVEPPGRVSASDKNTDPRSTD